MGNDNEINLKAIINHDKELKSSYQYYQSGDKTGDEHTFPIIDNQSSCETSFNDEKLFEKQIPFFDELENKDLDFLTEYDDEVQHQSAPKNFKSKVYDKIAKICAIYVLHLKATPSPKPRKKF